jgi:hypothetical protein
LRLIRTDFIDLEPILNIIQATGVFRKVRVNMYYVAMKEWRAREGGMGTRYGEWKHRFFFQFRIEPEQGQSLPNNGRLLAEYRNKWSAYAWKIRPAQ